MYKAKILILQNGVSHYRIPFYNGLAEYYDITVAYTGSTYASDDKKFKEIELKGINLMGFLFHRNLNQLVTQYDVVLAMFDLRWPSFILEGLKAENGILWSHCFGKNALLNSFRVWLLRKAKAVLAYYSDVFEPLIYKGIAAERLFSSGNTILVGSPQCAEYTDRNCFIYVGRYQERKRIDILVNSFAEALPFLSKDINLRLIGPGFDDFYKKNIEGKSFEDRIELLGPIYDEVELKRYFGAALGYISPGHVGLGVLHSFAFGVPVLTMNNKYHAPEFSNCKHMINSIIVDNEKQLTDALVLLDKDRELGATLAKNGYHLYVDERRMDQMISRTASAIEFALKI